MTKPGRHCRYNTPGPSPPDCYRGRRVYRCRLLVAGEASSECFVIFPVQPGDIEQFDLFGALSLAGACV